MSTIIFHERYNKSFGEEIPKLVQNKYLEVNNIIDAPIVLENELTRFSPIIYSYMLQKIKMWGCHTLYAQQLFSLIEKPNLLGRKKEKKEIRSGGIPIARMDFVTFLIGTSDCLVASDIVKIMSKFALAMPLVVCDLETNRYFFLLPLYKDVTIKWTVSEGNIIENYLFRSPFKILICVRVGDNGSQPGKSAILNKMMKLNYVFSSRGEPGGKYGKPITLDGTVEFTWLTEETCSETMWIQILKPYYAKGTNELILLANFHGDINNFADFLEVFEALSPNYLVFVMPSASNISEGQNEILNNAALHDALHIFVNPNAEHINEEYTIQTNDLDNYESTHDVLRALAEVIEKQKIVNEIDFDKLIVKSEKQRLVLSEKIYTSESEEVIRFVKKHKCKSSKQLLKTSTTLMEIFMKIFRLAPFEVRKAMAHLETELFLLANIESLAARERVEQLRKTLPALVDSETLNEQHASHQKNIDEALTEVDNINFGVEHFFREASHSFQTSILFFEDTPYLKLPVHCADLLLNGTAIELLNGDDQQVSAEWLHEICICINQRQPDIKIFVVSIIGLQSSGKSTLLNALFSCKFAVSVGRCSRGLFIRLAFLNEQLKNELGFDAFLLVDTEGLGSPEKMNEINAKSKDRRMATLAIGISDLTIINVMGEAINEITEILEIAMVAMTRLGKSDMASDILLVQHLTEKNKILSSDGKNNLCIALKLAFNVIQEYAVKIGTLDVACLSNLIQRIQSETFLKQFNPFKNGSTVYAPPSEGYHEDVVDLYKTILAVSNKVSSKQTLLNWSKVVAAYWNCAKDENFASLFQNVKNIIEYLGHEQKLEGIKNAIAYAYSSHCTLLESEMCKQINKSNYDKREFLSTIEGKLTDLPRRCSALTINNMICEQCKEATRLIENITQEVKNMDKAKETVKTILSFCERIQKKTLEKLSNMFDAMVFEDNFCDKYEEAINKELKLILNANKSKKFSEEQRTKEIEAIWGKLEILAAEGKVYEPVLKKIEREIKCAYQTNTNFWEIYQNKVENASFEKKSGGAFVFFKKLMMGHTKNSRRNAACKLLDELRILVQNLLGDNIDFHGFETRMIYTLKSDIEKVMQQIETEFNQVFEIQYRWMVHAYTLQLFCTEIEQKQLQWDLKHNPQFILQKNKSKYKKIIDTRLQLRFTAAGDGLIVARTLDIAMHKQAKSCVEQKLIEDLRKQDWVKSSEFVRLKYFEGLVSDVNRGMKKRAVDHFLRPTTEFESWFTQMIDTHDKKEMRTKYLKHLEESKSGILFVLLQSDIDKAVTYIKDYIGKTGEKYSFNHTEYTNEKKLQFMETVTNTVLDFKWDIDEVKNIALPSKNQEIMNLLGCTERCPICHALCWMSRGHVERISHWTCHQPVGLGLTCDYETNVLKCNSCHIYEDTQRFYYNEKHVLWSDVKRLNPKWSFENFSNDKFQDLMKWFMGKLHADVAASTKGYEPALQSDLQKYNCVNLEIGGVLRNIRRLVDSKANDKV